MSLQLSTELHKRGHAVTLAYESEGSMLPLYKGFAEKLHPGKIPCFGFRNLPNSLQSIRNLSKLIREEKIDVIFSSHLGHLLDLGIVGTHTRTPVVYYLGLPSGDGEAGGSRLKDYVNRWAVKHIHAGVACSQRVATSWRNYGWPEESLYVVPHWVDSQRFKPSKDRAEARRIAGLPEQRPIVMYVGRVVQDKGIEVLLRACGSMNKDASLVIVGRAEDSYVDRLKTIASELRISSRVMMIGNVAETEKYYRAADIVVVPSICDEAFGIVAIEAMASGALTITSSSGELPNVLGEANRDLVFTSENTQELSAMLDIWLNDHNALRRRGNLLRDYATEFYSVKDKLNAYESIMLSLVEKASVLAA